MLDCKWGSGTSASDFLTPVKQIGAAMAKRLKPDTGVKVPTPKKGKHIAPAPANSPTSAGQPDGFILKAMYHYDEIIASHGTAHAALDHIYSTPDLMMKFFKCMDANFPMD